MGASAAKDDLAEAVKRAETRAGKVGVSGRYHRLPKKLEDDYIIDKGNVLGSGYNGQVFKAKGVRSGDSFAVKGFHLNGISKDKLEELKTEAEIFLMMDHPHVARLVDVYECDKHLNLVMECMAGGEVFDRIRKAKTFPEHAAASTVYQMLLAVNYIHARDVVHRDLKLENFLYESKDGDHLKLIDFGFSHVWEKDTKMELSCGTLAYVAPEVLARSYTSQCDCWSMGVITFILLLGYMPFKGSEREQIPQIKTGSFLKRDGKWEKLSKNSQDFIERLLVVSPDHRLTAEQALAHPFIKDRQDAAENSREKIDEGIVSALGDFAKASQFRKACMSMMAWSLTNEERAQVRDAFIAIDTSKKGTITVAELKQVMCDQFEIADDQVKMVFDALDSSNDDEIHYTEFLAAMVSTKIKMHDDLLEATFRRFDVDNSGYITKDNLKTVLGDSFDGSQVEKLIEEADYTKDGQISYDEFLLYLKNQTDEDKQLMAAKLIDDAAKQKTLVTPKEEFPDGFLGINKKMRDMSAMVSATVGGGHTTTSLSIEVKQKTTRSGGTVSSTAATQGDPPKKSKACVLL